VTAPFLERAMYRNGVLEIGPARFSALHVAVEWLDAAALRQILRLGRQGLPICLARDPRQPGHRISAAYQADVAALKALTNVSSDLGKVMPVPPLVSGSRLPEYWVREYGQDLLIFFAHPLSSTVKYPLDYGQSHSAGPIVLPVTLQHRGRRVEVDLTFAPNQSLLLRLDAAGRVRWEDITLAVPRPRRLPPDQASPGTDEASGR